MMISPDAYYELELKGRSKTHILKEVSFFTQGDRRTKRKNRILSNQAGTLDETISLCNHRDESPIFKRSQESP